MIAKDKVVTFHYRLTDTEGVEIDSSEGQEPLTYLHGHGNIVAGLERELEGKTTGDSFDVVVKPVDGYGEYHDELVQTVPASAFEGAEKVEVGMVFTATTDQGPVPVRVVGVEEETVTVDGNHPLAGETLHFTGTVGELRDPSEEEITHGHVHGPGGPDDD